MKIIINGLITITLVVLTGVTLELILPTQISIIIGVILGIILGAILTSWLIKDKII